MDLRSKGGHENLIAVRCASVVDLDSCYPIRLDIRLNVYK